MNPFSSFWGKSSKFPHSIKYGNAFVGMASQRLKRDRFFSLLQQQVSLFHGFLSHLEIDGLKAEPLKEIIQDYTLLLRDHRLDLSLSACKLGVLKSLNFLSKKPSLSMKITWITACLRMHLFFCENLRGYVDRNDFVLNNWVKRGLSEEYKDFIEGLEYALGCTGGMNLQNLYQESLRVHLQPLVAEDLAFNPRVIPIVVPLANKDLAVSVMCNFDSSCTELNSCDLLLNEIKKDRPEIHEPELPYHSKFEKALFSLVDGMESDNRDNNFDYAGLRSALEKTETVKATINSRVAETNLLRGLSVDRLCSIGRSVHLNEGCLEFFNTMRQFEPAKCYLHIISYCWSGDLLRARFPECWRIHCNKLIIKDGITTGGIDRLIESWKDKLHYYKRFLSEYSGPRPKSYIDAAKKLKLKPTSVYIGRDVGDLGCLIEADVGILIFPSWSLLSLFNKFGGRVVPLHAGVVRMERALGKANTWNKVPGVLYRATSWMEIEACVLGYY